ncbi:MAG TPA: hypothetical protein PKW60_14425, partial [Candidatus Hydrogenedentes bacterium]|nr:hypothetical protein [Candidatus Hydrogenedentota bacterium]
GSIGNFHRYAQDILREFQYRDFYTHWSDVVTRALAEFPVDDLWHLNAEKRASQPTSQTAWDLRRALSRIDTLYGQGKLREAAQEIESNAPTFRMFAPEPVSEQAAPSGE